ncbi:hypothetical protein SDC9_130096 [bioreactor metagenome]|uniref:VTC domain-containing protein n=1 Tax=bioreactor metagenome TaxID=1076179 RepID=A0A645D1P6_9ZZZZ
MGYKRRVAMTYPQAIAFLNKGIRPDTDNTVDFQILNEIEWLIKSNPGIRPKMFISYERNAYFSSDDKRVRITFDKNIQWRTVSLALSAGIFGAQLLGEGEVLAEIKLPEAMPLWMARALDINKIYPVSLSKYGRAYQLFQIQAAKAEGVTFCA